MSEEKKDEDFVDKLKRMRSDMKSPSIIKDALDDIDTFKKENEELKETIKKYTEMINGSKLALKQTLEEKDKLKSESTAKIFKLEFDLSEKIKQYSELSERINDLENNLKSEKLKKVEAPQSKDVPPSDFAKNQDLVDSLSSELAKKKIVVSDLENKIKFLEANIEKLYQEKEIYNSKLSDTESSIQSEIDTQISKFDKKIEFLENKINELTLENKSLKDDLAENNNISNVDYVVPVVEAVTTARKPAPEQKSTLEILCQDLQSELNKYKRIAEKLKQQNDLLKKSQESGATPVISEDFSKFKEENITLKEEISKLKQDLQEEIQKTSKRDSSEINIRELEAELKEKDKIINNLKTSETSQVATTSAGPMSGLIEDLQGNINKLKLVIREKDKIIEELKRND